MSVLTIFITNNGFKQQIERMHNESDFKKACTIFRMFDDSVINDKLDEIVSFDPDFKFRFYHNKSVECNFDTFAMACYSNNLPLIKRMINQNLFKLNNKYQFGMSNFTTPLALLHTNNSEVYNTVKQHGDFSKVDNFGKPLIKSSALKIDVDEFEKIMYKIYCEAYDKHIGTISLVIYNGTLVCNNIFDSMKVTLYSRHDSENKLYNYYCENELAFVVSVVDQIFPKDSFKHWNIMSCIGDATSNILKLFMWYQLDDAILHPSPNYVTEFSELQNLARILKNIKTYNRQSIEKLHYEASQQFHSDLSISIGRYKNIENKSEYIKSKLLLLAIKTIRIITSSYISDDYDFAMEFVNTYEKNKALLIQYIINLEKDGGEYVANENQILADETIEKLSEYNTCGDLDLLEQVLGEYSVHLTPDQIALLKINPFLV
jgi:hypothetical protein